MLSIILYQAVSQKGRLKRNLLYHILTGKRTASTFYQAYRDDLSWLFAIDTSLKKEAYDQSLERLIRHGYLDFFDEAQEFLMLGEKIATDHGLTITLKYRDGLRFGKIEAPFDSFWQLFIQSLSYKQSNQNRYQPISQHVLIQDLVRQVYRETAWLTSHQALKELSHEIFNLYSEIEAGDFLAQVLSGYQSPGQTLDQLAKESNLAINQLTYLSYRHQIIEALFQKNTYPLLSQAFRIFTRTYPLVGSGAERTRRAMHLGGNRADLMKVLGIKESTINDHLIEIGLIYGVETIQPYLSVNLKEVSRFEVDQAYQDFNQIYPNLDFFNYRALQIYQIEVANRD